MQDENRILASVFIYVNAITHLDLLELHVLQSAMKQEPVLNQNTNVLIFSIFIWIGNYLQ